MDASSDGTSMNDLSVLAIPEMDSELLEKHFGDEVAKAIAANPDVTFCKVGASGQVDGNLFDFVPAMEGASDAMVGESISILPTFSVPCGSTVDASPALVAVAQGALAGAETPPQPCASGGPCKCASMGVSSGLLMQLDFNKLLEDPIIGKQMKDMGVDSVDKLVKVMKALPAQSGTDPAEQESAIALFEAMSDGIGFGSTTSMFACVAADSALGEQSIVVDDKLVTAEVQEIMAKAGFIMTLEATAAINVVEPVAKSAVAAIGDAVLVLVDGVQTAGEVTSVTEEGVATVTVTDEAGAITTLALPVQAMSSTEELEALNEATPPKNSVAERAKGYSSNGADAAAVPTLLAAAAVLLASARHAC